jgi:hypothetical protein
MSALRNLFHAELGRIGEESHAELAENAEKNLLRGARKDWRGVSRRVAENAEKNLQFSLKNPL